MGDVIEILTTSTNSVEVIAQGPQGPKGDKGDPGDVAGLPLSVQGDTLYRGASQNERLAIGSTGQVLKVSAQGLPTWASESGAVTSVNGQTGAVVITPTSISAAHALVIRANLALTADATLSAGRNIQQQITSYESTNLVVTLPTSDNEISDEFTIIGRAYAAGDILIRKQNWVGSGFGPQFTTLATVTTDLESYIFRYTINGWELLPSNADWNASAGSTSIQNKPVIPTASSATPQPLGTAAAGSSANFSRADHVHAMPTAANVGAAPTSRSISAGTGLTGGGNLTADRTLAVAYGTTSGTACQGNDARLSDSRTPTAHAASHAAGTKARYNDQVAGMTENVLIRADNVGTAGNSITLTFDGVDDIDTVLAAWNAANTSNTAELVLGDGSQVPDADEQFNLSGGVAAGSDPFTNQNVSFGHVAAASLRAEINGADSFVITPQQNAILRIDNTDAAALALFINNDQGKALLGVRNGNQAFLQNGSTGAGSDVFRIEKSGGSTANLEIRNLVLQDQTGNEKATFDAQANLTANRTYDLPDRSGELMIVGDAPASHTHGNLTNDGKVGSDSGRVLVTTTAGAVTTLALGTAGQILRTKSDLSGVEFADPAASGVTGAASSASDVLGVSGANITGVDANADRIVYWNNASNKLAYGTPADAGAAAASHTHTSADINSQTASNGHVLTANGSGGASFAALPASGISAVGASTADVLSVSGSDLIADDGGTIDSADPFIKWDDTAGKLVYANPLSRPSGAFYVGLAPTTTALGTNSINIQSARSAATQVASGTSALAIGNNSTASGGDSVAVGKTSISGQDSAAFGSDANANALQCTAIGRGAGFSGRATGSTFVGRNAWCSGVNGVALGNNIGDSLRAGFFVAPFNAVYWGGQTTNATATILNLDATATNRFTIAANTALAVDILLVARRSDTADKWLVARRFLGIRRDGSNNTSLIGSVQTLGTDQSEGSPSWSFTLTADDTNECLQLEVTGANSETVQWRATAFYRFV